MSWDSGLATTQTHSGTLTVGSYHSYLFQTSLNGLKQNMHWSGISTQGFRASRFHQHPSFWLLIACHIMQSGPTSEITEQPKKDLSNMLVTFQAYWFKDSSHKYWASPCCFPTSPIISALLFIFLNNKNTSVFASQCTLHFACTWMTQRRTQSIELDSDSDLYCL